MRPTSAAWVLTDLRLLLQLRGSYALGDRIQMVGLHVRERLHEAAWPLDGHVGRRGTGQTEMNAPGVLRPPMVSAILRTELGHAKRCGIHARAGGIAVRVHADQVEFNPMV